MLRHRGSRQPDDEDLVRYLTLWRCQRQGSLSVSGLRRHGPKRSGGQECSSTRRGEGRLVPRVDTSAEGRRVEGSQWGGDTVDVLWRSQAQPPPTMYISWQGRYTDNLHVVTSSASTIFMSRSLEVQGV